MIGYIKGKISAQNDRSVIIDVGGIGYEIQLPRSSLVRLASLADQDTMLYTHLSWKDDEVNIYGFETMEARDMFRLLLGVSGIGPRLALNILSSFSPDDLLIIISSEDAKRLQSISGVGKRTAARLCVDLKEKAKTMIKGRIIQERPLASHIRPVFEDAHSALLRLGYRPAEASSALEKAIKKLGQDAGLEEMVKEALKYLAKT